MDISPISPTRARSLATIPTTPVIGPSLYLPRLVTCFQGPAGIDGSARRISPVLQLPTPSPLSLNRVSAMSERMQRTTHFHTLSDSSVETIDTMKVSPTYSTLASSSDGSPNDKTPSSYSPSTIRRMPTLIRQNANEGLERLSPNDRLVPGDLPGRENCLTAHCAVSNSAASSAGSGTTLLIPRPRSRSPISKHPHQRRSTLRQQISRITTQSATRILTIRSPVSPNTQSRNHEIRARVAHLSRPLVPLVSVRDGRSHPAFPTSILQYQLLTHEQLDGLARWYHQTGDAGEERWLYPKPISPGKAWIGEEETTDTVVDLQTKRRRWGRFIGLRGCETPEGDDESIEEMEARLERQWIDGIRRAREAAAAREKLGRGWF